MKPRARQSLILLISLLASCDESQGQGDATEVDETTGAADDLTDLTDESTEGTTEVPCTLPYELDVAALAFATLSGEADWSVSLRNGTWGDLDGDGNTDLILHWYADDDPTDPSGFDNDLGTMTRHVGWFRGPFVGDVAPEVLIEGQSDPFRGPDDWITVADLDGDGYVDLLVPYEQYSGPLPDEVLPGLDDEEFPETFTPEKRSGAWFAGPFGAIATSFGDADFVEAAGRRAFIDDFNDDGSPDLFLTRWIDVTLWRWFDALDRPPTVDLSTLHFDFTTNYADDPYRQPDGLVGLISRSPFNQSAIGSDLLEQPTFSGDQSLTVVPRKWPDGSQKTHYPLGDLDADLVADEMIIIPDLVNFPPEHTREASLSSGGAASFKDIDIANPEPTWVGDVDGDGYDDLGLMANTLQPDHFSQGVYEFWLILGPLEPRAYTLHDVVLHADGPTTIAVGDLDGDGFTDLAFDQPGWPQGIYPENSRQSGRIWLVSGATLAAAIDACQGP